MLAARQDSLGACDGEAPLVQQGFYGHHHFNVLLSIHAASIGPFGGCQHRELSLPKTEHIGFELEQFRNLSNTEEQFVGNIYVVHSACPTALALTAEPVGLRACFEFLFDDQGCSLEPKAPANLINEVSLEREMNLT